MTPFGVWDAVFNRQWCPVLLRRAIDTVMLRKQIAYKAWWRNRR